MIKHSKRWIRSVAAICLTLSVIATAEEQRVRVGSMTVEQPADWYQATVPSDEPFTRAVIASNTPKSDQAIMMISIEPANGRTLEALNSATRNYIVTQMDGVVEYERPGSVDGAPSHTFVYEGRSEHKGRRKFSRTIVKKGDSFYILHGVADHVPFSKHAGTLDGIVKSVQWNE